MAEPKRFTVDWDASAAEKGGWPSFMDKEIHEDPAAVADTLLGRFDEKGDIVLDEVRIEPDAFRSVDKIIVVACGTASYAGLVAKYAIEHWVRIPVAPVWWPNTPSSIGCASRWRSSSPTSSATATRS